MSTRASMAGLIARVRRLIRDTGTGSPVFTDEQIQDSLDLYREDVRYQQLEALPVYGEGTGAAQYLTHRSCLQFWEADVQLVDLGYHELTVASGGADPIGGRWVLAESCFAVLASGQVFDVYRTAADLLDEWIASLKTENDFTDGRRSFSDSQTRETLEKLARQYRRRGRVGSGKLVSGDASATGTSERTQVVLNDFFRSN